MLISKLRPIINDIACFQAITIHALSAAYAVRVQPAVWLCATAIGEKSMASSPLLTSPNPVFSAIRPSVLVNSDLVGMCSVVVIDVNWRGQVSYRVVSCGVDVSIRFESAVFFACRLTPDSCLQHDLTETAGCNF